MSADTSAQPLLSARGLRCERDDRVLFEQLDFSLELGTVMQVEGPNGSGKTTLLRILCGLNKDYEGELFFKGQPLESCWYDYRSALCTLGHAPGIKANLTPLENLQWSLALHTDVDIQAIEQALDRVGLYGFEDQPCHSLSAGQQRRVSLARLHLSAAPLWILDEPFTAIDKAGVKALEGFVLEHAEQGGAVILTTHHQLQLQGRLRVLSLGGSQA